MRMTFDASTSRRLEIALLQKLTEKYGSVLPVKITFRESAILTGWTIDVDIPGQSKRVLVWAKDLLSKTESELIEAVADDVLFATFQLLEEGDDV